jgi:hypothetical protein
MDDIGPSWMQTCGKLWLIFVRSNQDLVYASNTHYIIFEYMGTILIAWVGMGGHMSCYGWAHVILLVGMGGHRLLRIIMVWVWVQIRRKMLGSAS